MKKLYIVFSLLIIQNFVFASSHVSTSKSKRCQRKGHQPIVLKPISFSSISFDAANLKQAAKVLKEAQDRTSESNQSLYCIKHFDRPYVRLDVTGFPQSAIDVPYIQSKVIPWLNYVFASPITQSLYVKEGVFQKSAFRRDVKNVAIMVSNIQKLTEKEIHSAPFIKSQVSKFFAIQAEQLAQQRARKEANEVEANPVQCDDAVTRARRKFFEKD